MFMDDEKKLMNCVTYSLGELASRWQRPQMRVLESHLRLVNVLTESLNELYQYQLVERKCFRPSVAKKVHFFRFTLFYFTKVSLSSAIDLILEPFDPLELTHRSFCAET